MAQLEPPFGPFQWDLESEPTPSSSFPASFSFPPSNMSTNPSPLARADTLPYLSASLSEHEHDTSLSAVFGKPLQLSWSDMANDAVVNNSNNNGSNVGSGNSANESDNYLHLRLHPHIDVHPTQPRFPNN